MIPDTPPYALPTWLEHNRFSHDDFSIPVLKNAIDKEKTKITVIIPARGVADTIAGVILETVHPLLTAGIVTDLVVIDNASKDGTGAIAASHGARVIQRQEIAQELGPSRGKGDALWRALLVTDGDIVAFLDGDTSDPSPAHLIGILGPLIMREEIQMVRACFERHYKSANGELTQNGGGRVTEILARPLLNCFWPELAGFSQPLAGEFAARRGLLEKLPFPVAYGVEISTLIDTYNLLGLRALAQVDVGCRQNSHQPLRALTVMAQGILSTAMRRADKAALSMSRMFLPWTDAFEDVEVIERLPLDEYRRPDTAERLHGPHEIWPYPGRPFVTVQGVRMFRDIGGYQTTDGRSVRSGLIFRSGELSQMTVVGQEMLQDLGVQTIFDLRSMIEVNNKVHQSEKRADSGLTSPISPCQEDGVLSMAGIDIVSAPVFADSTWLPGARDERLKQYASAAEGYATAYMHTLSHWQSAFRNIFQHLAQDNPNPILFHCSAGKDRTGVLSMLLLRLAGCDAHTISYEYALNDLDTEWRADAIKRLLSQPGLNGNVGSVTNVVRARSEYMDAAVEMLDQRFGGAHSYLKQELGLNDEAIASVKTNLLR